MSEDIHKWTDGRYTLMFDEHTFFVFDNEKEERMTALEVTKKLNEQQATITHLEEENEQLRQQVQNAKELAVENDVQYQICRKEKEDFQNMCEQLRHELDSLSGCYCADNKEFKDYWRIGYDD